MDHDIFTHGPLYVIRDLIDAGVDVDRFAPYVGSTGKQYNFGTIKPLEFLFYLGEERSRMKKAELAKLLRNSNRATLLDNEEFSNVLLHIGKMLDKKETSLQHIRRFAYGRGDDVNFNDYTTAFRHLVAMYDNLDFLSPQYSFLMLFISLMLDKKVHGGCFYHSPNSLYFFITEEKKLVKPSTKNNDLVLLSHFALDVTTNEEWMILNNEERKDETLFDKLVAHLHDDIEAIDADMPPLSCTVDEKCIGGVLEKTDSYPFWQLI